MYTSSCRLSNTSRLLINLNVGSTYNICTFKIVKVSVCFPIYNLFGVLSKSFWDFVTCLLHNQQVNYKAYYMKNTLPSTENVNFLELSTWKKLIIMYLISSFWILKVHTSIFSVKCSQRSKGLLSLKFKRSNYTAHNLTSLRLITWYFLHIYEAFTLKPLFLPETLNPENTAYNAFYYVA